MTERIQIPLDYSISLDKLDPASRARYERLLANIKSHTWTVIVGDHASGKSSMLIGIDTIYGRMSRYDVSDVTDPSELEKKMAQQKGKKELALSELPEIIMIDEFTNINLSGKDMTSVVNFLYKCRAAGKTVFVACRRGPINPSLEIFFTDEMTLEPIPPEKWLAYYNSE